MLERITDFLSPLGSELTAFIISMIPFIELRGGIIFAHASEMDPVMSLIICFIGNCIPIPFVIFLARPCFQKLKKVRFMSRIINKIESTVEKKANKVKAKKYELVGLLLFVGIPLPGTGAYTGSLIAAFLNMRIKYAVPAIMLGVLSAGLIMTAVSMGMFSALDFLLE